MPSSSYSTLAAALADITCEPIQVAAGTLVENVAVTRSVSIVGAGSAATTVVGWIAVRGAATTFVLDALRLDATSATAELCHASGLDVRGGAHASGSDLVVVGRPASTAACGFFADGFESGDLAAWSSQRP